MKTYLVLYYVLKGNEMGMHQTVFRTSRNLNTYPGLKVTERLLQRKLKTKKIKILSYTKIEGVN